MLRTGRLEPLTVALGGDGHAVEVQNETRDLAVLVATRHRQQIVHPASTRVPITRRVHRILHMKQRPDLTNSGITNRVNQERNPVDQRRSQPRRHLSRKIVAILELRQPEVAEVTVRPDHSIKIASTRQDVDRFRRPTENQAQPVVLRRDDRANLANRPLAVVVRRAQQVPVRLVRELIEQTIDQSGLVLRKICHGDV